MRQLLGVAEFEGWDIALYDYFKVRVLRDGTVPEDQRVADWGYLLPLNRNTVALVLGCGLGDIPISLSRTCKAVYAADSSWERISFLNIRKKQQGIGNLWPVCISADLNLPFHKECFDLVSVRGFRWEIRRSTTVQDVIRCVHNLLKECGILHLSFGNRLAFHHLLWREKNTTSIPLHTIFGYRRILQAEGFSEVRFYAPLPHHDGLPLFYVPLDESRVLSFFFRNLFPLFEMVSPEVKRAYALEYKMAKIGVRFSLRFGLTRFAKFFVPGFLIIAKKVAPGA